MSQERIPLLGTLELTTAPIGVGQQALHIVGIIFCEFFLGTPCVLHANYELCDSESDL